MSVAQPELTIDKAVLRQFILGKQGLYPGRRWRGKPGALQAMREHCVVQIDPLAIIARSPDLALQGRVLDYSAAHLESLLYEDHLAFEYGNLLRAYPIEDLPYFLPLMHRKRQSAHWARFTREHPGLVEDVRTALQERGPLGPRDLEGKSLQGGSYRASKDSGLALYYLWITGELLIHSRRRSERVYTLREPLTGPDGDAGVSEAEAEDFLARKAFLQLNLATFTEWRGWFSTLVERRVEQAEGRARLQELLQSGWLAQVSVAGEKLPRFPPAADLPLLLELERGNLPAGWQPLETTHAEEMVFLAPLEIATARGRALPLFGFEYLWEVYKPAAQRRWGYYTLPILHGDRLVARFDSKLNRAEKTLEVLNFWLEEDVQPDPAFLEALAAGFARFIRFLEGSRLALPPGLLPGLAERVHERLGRK
jgi:uncharacterized protein